MKKALALVLSAVMMLALFAGCGSSAEQIDQLNALVADMNETIAEIVEYQTTDAATTTYNPYTSSEHYEVIPISMTMQAGFQEYQAYDSGMMTIHAGIGYIDPLGEGHYYAGIGYDEIAGNEEAIYVSDWMDANFGCSLFCIYSLPEGDIYAWDGIYGANATDLSNYMSGEDGYTPEEVNGTVPTRGDTLINIIVGGTGRYAGATGVLIGTTSGGGVYDTVDGMTLPQTLFKLMEGYIKIPTEVEEGATSSHTVTQELSEERAGLEVTPTDYAMVDVELRLQSGALEADNAGLGAGVGTMLPFNAQAMTSESGNDLEIAANYPVENYFNDNWLEAYGAPTFVVYHVNDGTIYGDLYGWQFEYGVITDSSDPLSASGSQSAVFTLIVGGTGHFIDVTGILSGHTVNADPEGWGEDLYKSNAPLCAMTLLEGSLKVPSGHRIVTAGYANAIIG